MSVRLFFSIAMIAGGAVGAQAQTAAAGNTEFVQRLLGKTPVNAVATACYTRVYDANHLAAHPKQKVTQMHVIVRGDTRGEETGVIFSFVVGVKKRGDKDLLTGSGSCGQARAQEGEGPVTHIGCGIDCDGGGVSIEPGKTDKSILVKINDYISVSRPDPKATENDEPGERTGVRAGEDDKLFRLERVAIEQCAKLFDNKEAYRDFIAPKD